jgi:hypothetical protein
MVTTRRRWAGEAWQRYRYRRRPEMQRIRWRKIGIVLLALAVIAGVSVVAFAQDGDDEPRAAAPVAGDPAQYADPPAQEEAAGGDDLNLKLAQPPFTMNYQGYLTNSSGSPYNGTVNISASLYNLPAGGSLMWGPEVHNGVSVANGLFQLVLGTTTALEPADFSSALYLHLVVGGTTMPRQPLRGSAYAFSVAPGAEIDGVPNGATYAFKVTNADSAETGRGIYANAMGYAIYASEGGTGDTAIYTPDYIRARGLHVAEDSYLFVPGMAGKPWDDAANSALIVDAQSNGTVRLRARSNPGTYYFYIPINTLAVLYGQNVTVEELLVYYQVDNAASFITEVSLERGAAAGSSVALVSDATDLKSTTATTKAYTPANAELSSSAGYLMARFVIVFANTTQGVEIGGIRLRLGTL